MKKDVYFQGVVAEFSVRPSADKQGFALLARTVGRKKIVLQFPLSSLGQLVVALGGLLDKTSKRGPRKLHIASSRKLH